MSTCALPDEPGLRKNSSFAEMQACRTASCPWVSWALCAADVHAQAPLICVDLSGVSHQPHLSSTCLKLLVLLTLRVVACTHMSMWREGIVVQGGQQFADHAVNCRAGAPGQ